MRKQKLMKTAGILFCTLMLVTVSACGNASGGETGAPETTAAVKTTAEKETETPAPSTAETPTETAPTEAPTAPSKSGEAAEYGILEKISGVADDAGIYSMEITLGKQAADKGAVEMVFHGVPGTAEENSVVNTFLIRYEKDGSGKFEINTFYDGEVYQNYHQKDRVKVGVTFGAATRGGDVVIFYTPDGGEKQDVFIGQAEQFRTGE